jgi:hypothetical protein
MLLSAYPSARPSDAEYYVSLVVTVFTRFSDDLVRRAVEPGGIMRDHPTYLPTVGEITAWLQKRADMEAPRPRALPEPPIDRTGRPSYEELQARCAKVGLFIGKHPKEREISSPEAIKAKYCISDEVWNAIPDAATYKGVRSK